MPLETLLQRLEDSRAKALLQDVLREVKAANPEAQRAFRVTGSTDDVLEATRQAVGGGYLTIDRLARLVDEIEENGAQHILLLKLTAAGRERLTFAALSGKLPAAPGAPTVALYADPPPTTRMWAEQRPDAIVVKQITEAVFWEADPAAAEDTPDKRVRVTVRRRVRAVNLIRIQLTTNEVEVRIARGRNQDDPELAAELFDALVEALGDAIDLAQDFEPVEIWRGFQAIVENRDDTFMSVDEARDTRVKQTISNRREETKGQDVRDHEAYNLLRAGLRRDRLNVYWLLPGLTGGKVHSLLSRFATDEYDTGKIYLGAKVSAEQVRHVVQRVRDFAG